MEALQTTLTVQAGSVSVVKCSGSGVLAGETTIEKVFETGDPSAAVTLTPNVKVPVLGGTPLNTPALDKLSHSGRFAPVQV
jgi:hypothetical protein